MSDLDNPGDTWHGLIGAYASTLGFHETVPITTEVEHKKTFKTLCNQYKERQDERLLTRIHRQHDRILEFLTTLDTAHGLEPPSALISLFWHLSIQTVHGAFKSKIPLSTLLRETNNLNQEFPALNHELLSRYYYDPKVQKPLQDLFKKYFDSYLTMFMDAATYPSLLDLEKFSESIKDVGQLFLTYTASWDSAWKVADITEKKHDQSGWTSVNGSMTLSNPSQRTNARFEELRVLGHGTYGEVTAVQEYTTKSEYARKLIRVRDRNNSAAREAIEKHVKAEVEIMQKLRHHHIASVLFYTREPPGHVFNLIMLPVGDYDLRRFLEEECVTAGYPDKEIKKLDKWFGCLASALAYAHNESVKHEDIKPSNILIKDSRPYLADFGSAKDFSQMEASTSPDAQIAGTPIYWPPESIAQRGRPADVFSLGCVFSEMLTVRQHRPLVDYRNSRHVEDTDNGFAFKNNLPGVNSWLKSLPGIHKTELEVLLLDQTQKMLEVNPDHRPYARQVRKSFRSEEDHLLCASCS